jgi:hypothetical protein
VSACSWPCRARWAAAAKGSGDGGVFVGGLGALASACVRQDCSSLLSASATYERIGGGQSDNSGALVYGLSLVHRVGSHVKLLAEVASGTSFSSSDLSNGALLSYGVRFYGNSIASDIGFIKPISSNGDSPFLMGLPFASVSYRWQ